MHKSGDLYTNKESTFRIDEVGEIYIKCSIVHHKTNTVLTSKVFPASVNGIIIDGNYKLEGNYTNKALSECINS